MLLLAVRLIWRSLKRRALKAQGQPHVAAEIGRIRPAAEQRSRKKIVVRLCSDNSALGSSQHFLSFPAPSSRENIMLPFLGLARDGVQRICIVHGAENSESAPKRNLSELLPPMRHIGKNT